MGSAQAGADYHAINDRRAGFHSQRCGSLQFRSACCAEIYNGTIARAGGTLSCAAGQVNQRLCGFCERRIAMRVIIVLVRSFLGLLLALFAIISALMGCSFLAYENGKFLGTNGTMFLLGVLVAAALGTASWKLLSTTLRLPAAA
jgi:hypothetical protein